MNINKGNKHMLIFVLLFITILLSLTLIKIEIRGDQDDNNLTNKNSNENLRHSTRLENWNLTGKPIFIDDWSRFYNWERVAFKNEWCSGSGTVDDPYIIENILIDGKNSGSCITIRNSNAHFIVRNCTLYNAGWSKFSWEAAIKLINTKNGKLVNNNCSFNKGCGILQFWGYNNNFTKNLINYNSHHGIYYWFSDNNLILENEINNNEINGIYCWFSDKNNISANAINFNQNGLNIAISNHNRITENYIVGNNVSIYQFRSQGNIIQNNKYEYESPTPDTNNEENLAEEDEDDDDESEISEDQEIPNISLIILSTLIGMLSGGIIGYMIHKKKIQKTSIIPVSKLLKEKPKFDSIQPIEEKSPPGPVIGLIPKKAIVKFKDLKKMKEKDTRFKDNLSQDEE
ncbi:MAG: hypothetical protein EU532_03410 [Promethearchaeota archaeon]|nr:MAG: hypothetical protein EU532_03410 [Candidatus Lokiarchaeota archaeon]